MIQSAKYVKGPVNGVEQNISVNVTYTGGQVWSVPLNVADNTHWIELQEWVSAGNTIEEAD
jgi:hypothetical protein|tara:strand:- start:1 stop:183 length:183 start_codon:yes stop_codon:yes gene_type:complete